MESKADRKNDNFERSPESEEKWANPCPKDVRAMNEWFFNHLPLKPEAKVKLLGLLEADHRISELRRTKQEKNVQSKKAQRSHMKKNMEKSKLKKLRDNQKKQKKSKNVNKSK